MALCEPGVRHVVRLGSCTGRILRASFDERRRLLQSLQSLRLPCLDPIIAEANATGGRFHSNWQIEISNNEMSQLDALVTAFMLLKQNEDLLSQQEQITGGQGDETAP